MAEAAQKALELQRMVVQQQQAAARYISDLERWEEEIQLQDKQLQRTAKVFKQPEFPVRGAKAPLSSAAIEKAPKEAEVQTSVDIGAKAEGKKEIVPGKRINSYDYRSWDKLDVDAMLEQDEDSKNAVSTSVPSSAIADIQLDADKEKTLQEHMALQEKEKYKQGKYEAAVACYTRGLEYDPASSVLVANRGMAYLALKRYAEAEKDCSLAIQLDNKYVKAYSRRAAARAGLGQHAGAVTDLQRVLDLEPANKEAEQELARQKAAKKEETERKAFNPLRELHEKTSKMRRVPIVEVGEPRAKAPAAAASTKPVVSTLANGEEGPVSEVESPKKVVKAAPPAPLPTVKSAPIDPGTVQTAAQFERAWRQLVTGDSDALYTFFKAIPTSAYPALLKTNMEGGTLMEIIALLKRAYIPRGDSVAGVLRALMAVPRFDMAVMFLEDKEKADVREVLAWARTHDGLDDGAWAALAKQYGVK